MERNLLKTSLIQHIWYWQSNLIIFNEAQREREREGVKEDNLQTKTDRISKTMKFHTFFLTQ